MANYISQVTLPNGTSYNVRELFPHVGNCTDAAATAAKTVTIGNFKLYTGAWVVVKFSNTNSAAVASLTLNVDGTGAKPIKYRNANLSSAGLLIANRYTYFIYDGTNYQIVGDFDTNSDTYDRNRYKANIKAGTSALVAGNIIVGKDGVFNHLKSGGSFDISYPILYLNGAVAAGDTTNNSYDIINFTITTTQSISLTSYLPVFIKGTLSGKIFTPVSAVPLTQTVPTTDDGYQYMYLGNATSTSAVYLTERHPIYAFKNNAFGEIVHTASNATQDGDGNTISSTYLKLSGGTMTGDITFTGVGTSSYPSKSKGIYWSGGTDAIDMYYNLRASDAGELIINMRDDSNVRTSFAYNGTVKSYIDTNGTYNGNATSATKSTQDGDGNTISSTYLKLSGGTMTGDIEYAGDGNRKIVLGKNSFKYYVASNAGWAGGLSYYSNDGSTGLGYFGAYGQANTLEYHFIGGTYNAPQIKIEPTGPNLIINSEDASTPMITFFRKGSNKADWRIVNTGGNLKFQSDYTTTVGDWYDALTVEYNTGNITMKTNATFTFGKFVSASANANRHVFFKEDNANRICVNDNFKYNPSTNILTVGSITGNAANVTGTVAIANGGTGATTRLAALKALTNEGVGTNAQYFLTITQDWGKGGYSSVANVKTVLGLKSAAYTESSEYAPSSHTHGNITNGGALQTTDITIASGDKLVVTDSSNSNKVARASISFDGSTTSKCLTQKGTWETPPDTKNTAGSTDTSSKIFLIGATSQAANPQTYSDDQCYVTSGTLQANKVQASVTVCANTANSTSAGGIALYSTDPEVYGIMFRGTSNSGKHGYVQSDWATYFTMNQGATTRGWIFRKKTDGPVASISGAGNAVFNGSVTVGGNTTNTSGCRMEYNSTTQTLDFVFV